MRITYLIYKKDVLNGVKRLTSYGGSRKQGADGAYERMSATDSDEDMLEQLWRAACSAATEHLMHYARSIEINVEGNPYYEVVAEMPSLYDINLNDSIKDSIKNFFINFITSKWYKITSPDDEAKYAAEALGYMQDVERKIYHRKRPRRFID